MQLLCAYEVRPIVLISWALTNVSFIRSSNRPSPSATRRFAACSLKQSGRALSTPSTSTSTTGTVPVRQLRAP